MKTNNQKQCTHEYKFVSLQSGVSYNFLSLWEVFKCSKCGKYKAVEQTDVELIEEGDAE